MQTEFDKLMNYKPLGSHPYASHGNFIVNSEELLALCLLAKEIHVTVLNLGALHLEKSKVVTNIRGHKNINGIKITLLDDDLIINNPEWLGVQRK